MLIKRSAYLGLSILEMSKTVIYKFWNDYVKSKYGEKAKLCYMDKTALQFTKTQKIFMWTLQKMQKQDLIPQLMDQTEQYLKEKIKQ